MIRQGLVATTTLLSGTPSTGTDVRSARRELRRSPTGSRAIA